MKAIEAVNKLSSLGYRFELAGDRLRYQYHGPGKPDLDTVRPLLETVKAHKPDVMAYLSKPTLPERILTCYECPLHEHDMVNPSQGWGHCKKRNRGRYGVATACEAILTPPDAPGEAIYHQTGVGQRGCNRDCPQN